MGELIRTSTGERATDHENTLDRTAARVCEGEDDGVPSNRIVGT
jgi:hypothetical protein